ncbi:hypothetical protein PRJ_1136 [Pseudomonas sp. XWY-1]|nr:hypothetical protein PRJ_1136 [Pseudomonas sp. XWY-1]
MVSALAECLERGEAPPAVLAEYFAQAFRQIAAGRPADAMLNTDGKSTFNRRDYEIAREVWTLNHRAVDRLPLRDNGEKTGAYSAVGEKHKLGPERIRQIYKDMRTQVEAEFFDTPSEARPQLEVDMQVAFGQLAEALKKQGRN